MWIEGHESMITINCPFRVQEHFIRPQGPITVRGVFRNQTTKVVRQKSREWVITHPRCIKLNGWFGYICKRFKSNGMQASNLVRTVARRFSSPSQERCKSRTE